MIKPVSDRFYHSPVPVFISTARYQLCVCQRTLLHFKKDALPSCALTLFALSCLSPQGL